MRCRDGTALVARIWQPEGDGPWPVLLMRQPYGRAIASTVTYAHPSWYASQGFLVVVQDVRGQGDSEGSFGGFRQEASDSADAVRWARGLPGSNQRLGTYGFSYQGLSQLLNDAGPEDPKALPDCTAPAMAGPDERLHWACEGGAHWWGLGLGWGLQLAALQCRRRGDAEGWQRIRRSLESGAFLSEGAALLRQLDPGGMAAGWLAADPEQVLPWLEHRINPELLLRPMLLIGGWYDPHLRGVLELWQRSLTAGGAPQLRISAWSHLNWRGGIDAIQLAFFQRHLRHEGQFPPNPEKTSPIQLQCQISQQWLQPSASDLSQTAGSWGLRSQGLAAVDPLEGQLLLEAPGAGGVTLVHDPWRPVPGRGGHLGLDAGPCQRADLDGRCDVACFTSAPLEQALQLLGQPVLRLTAQADQDGFDLCAALSRLSANGTVEQLSTGVLRQRGEACRQSRQLRLELQPLLARLQPGERLRLSLAAAAWPQIAVNPGDGSIPSGPSGPAHRVISISLQLDQAHLSVLPLLA